MRMRAGKLRHTLTFQEPVDVPDNAGGQSRTWTLVKTRRCDEVVQSGKLFQALHQRFAQMTHMFTLRDTEINQEWRVIFKNKAHRIVTVIEKDNRQIQLITEQEHETRTYGH